MYSFSGIFNNFRKSSPADANQVSKSTSADVFICAYITLNKSSIGVMPHAYSMKWDEFVELISFRTVESQAKK